MIGVTLCVLYDMFNDNCCGSNLLNYPSKIHTAFFTYKDYWRLTITVSQHKEVFKRF